MNPHNCPTINFVNIIMLTIGAAIAIEAEEDMDDSEFIKYMIAPVQTRIIIQLRYL